MGFFIEVLFGGFLAGVLYALVALGFVLIFKASGVFNFAQGAMVLFAALSLVRLMEWLPIPLALAATVLIMIALAFVVERLVLRPLVNQDGIILFMATIGVSYFIDGFGQTVWGSEVYKLDLGLPKDPMFILEGSFDGGLLVNASSTWSPPSPPGCSWRSSPSSSRRPGSGAPCAPSPTTTRRPSRSAFP
jgi:branched-chain amino acid transport system permease protein